MTGPHFGGWEIYHVKGSPADPNRIYASQSSSWFGQVVQRSDDGGRTWEPVDNRFVYDGTPGTHRWYDGTPHPWEFARVWHFEPSPHRSPIRFMPASKTPRCSARPTAEGAGKSSRRCARHPSAEGWQPGAGGMCLHTIILDPNKSERIFTAISAAGAFRSDDAGATWMPINRGLRSEVHSASRRPRSVTACIASRCTRAIRTCCSCRSTGT